MSLPSPAVACHRHPSEPGVARCVDCDAPLCSACRCRHGDRTRCQACHRRLLAAGHPAQGPGAPRLLATVTTLVSAGVLGVFIAGVVVTEVRAGTEVRQNLDALRALRFSLEDFYLDLTRYPSGAEGLGALVTSDPRVRGRPLDGWQGPYLRLTDMGLRYDRGQGVFVDAWENPILYWTEPDERWVYVASAGPDRVLDSPGLGTLGFDGTVQGDDLVVWVEGP